MKPFVTAVKINVLFRGTRIFEKENESKKDANPNKQEREDRGKKMLIGKHQRTFGKASS